MNERELHYIKTIVDEKCMTRAAQKLYISQPSLSQTVMKIEESLGMPLFTRTPSGLRPTLAGKEYYKVAVEILDKYELFRSMIQNTDNLNSGRITFGLLTMLSSILPKVLPEFIRLYPEIGLTVKESSDEKLRALLGGGDIHFALLYLDTVEDLKEKFELQYVADDELVIVAHKNHKLFQSAVRSPHRGFPVAAQGELRRYPVNYLQVDGPLGARCEKLLSQAGIDKTRSAPVIRSSSTAIRLSVTGLGITVCPRRSIPDDIPEDCILSFPKTCDSTLQLYAAYPGNRRRTKAETAFYECLIECLRH